MQKLLQINVTANRGSTGRIAEQIGEKVIAAGWESYIAYGRDCGASKSHLIKIGSRLGVLWHALMTRITDRHGLFSRIATKRLVRRINEINPDIVHLHNIHGYYINYRTLFNYLNQADIPVVWTLHDCWSMTGHCTHFEIAKCDKWQSACYACPQRDAYPASLVLDRSKCNYLDKRQLFSTVNNLTIVPVSNWLANIVRNSFLREKRISVIYNGIDVQMFHPCKNVELEKQYNLGDKRVVLGVASPWSDKKGLSDILKLYTLLPRDKYQIVLIGLTPKQLNQLPAGVIGLCRTNSVSELAEWYSLSDVFVNLTYEDTYPTTNLEAISCGTPVVTYRTGGSPESVTSQTGRVVDKGDINGVARAVEEVCAEDRETLRGHCREYAVEHFDSSRNYNMYVDLYREILNNK